MNQKMRYVLVVVGLVMLTGCRGIQSEMEKSAIRDAQPTADIGGNHISFSADLAKEPNKHKKGFDLAGTIRVSAQNKSFPTGLSVPGFSLRPSWSGRPGYYVMNFSNRGGKWELVGMYGVDRNFSGTSQITNGVYTIHFRWRNQGVGHGMKPEHFAAYDVAVTISDGQKNYLLSQLKVPTK